MGNYKIQIEKPFRAYQQLKCLGISLAKIHGRDNITDHEKEMLRRVVLSSGPSNRVKVLSMFRNGDNELKITAKMCSKVLGKSENRARSVLDELTELGILERIEVGGNHYWVPKKEFKDIMQKPFDDLDHIKDLEANKGNIPPTHKKTK